jgi:uncharacterized protein
MEKIHKLRDIMKSLGSVAVAFSGGVDSSLLLVVAFEVLGPQHCLAVCANSEVFTSGELADALAFCQERSIPLISFEHKVMQIPGFVDNPPNRCYICKKSLLEKIRAIADRHNLAHVVEGSNTDDLIDSRPGRQAILECGVISPLLEAGLTKSEIRTIAADLKLPNANKPAQACLATRFAFGAQLSNAELFRVEQAEGLLRDMGFNLVRVRVEGRKARIECDQPGLALLADQALRNRVQEEVQELGFSSVEIDLRGYQQGSMNKVDGEKRSDI